MASQLYCYCHLLCTAIVTGRSCAYVYVYMRMIYIYVYIYICICIYICVYIKQNEVSVSKGLKPTHCVSLEVMVARMVTCSREL